MVAIAKLLPRIYYYAILARNLKHVVRQLLFGKVKLRDMPACYQIKSSENSMFEAH